MSEASRGFRGAPPCLLPEAEVGCGLPAEALAKGEQPDEGAPCRRLARTRQRRSPLRAGAVSLRERVGGRSALRLRNDADVRLWLLPAAWPDLLGVVVVDGAGDDH